MYASCLANSWCMGQGKIGKRWSGWDRVSRRRRFQQQMHSHKPIAIFMFIFMCTQANSFIARQAEYSQCACNISVLFNELYGMFTCTLRHLHTFRRSRCAMCVRLWEHIEMGYFIGAHHVLGRCQGWESRRNGSIGACVLPSIWIGCIFLLLAHKTMGRVRSFRLSAYIFSAKGPRVRNNEQITEKKN